MTPNDIEILIHYHCSRAPFPRINAPASQDAIEMFCKENILKIEDAENNVYETTPKGKALVELLCRTEFPRSIFVDKDGNEIEFML